MFARRRRNVARKPHTNASEPSAAEKILRVRSGTPARLDQLSVQIAELERLAVDGDVAGTLRQLGCIVPTFQPGPSSAEPVRS